MSLSTTLNIARSGLAVNQAALQTVGNNISNVGNPNYTRQTANIATQPDYELSPGKFVGNGVRLDGISRQIDDALEGRLRNSTSDSESAGTQQQWLSRVEAVFNELSDQDLSSKLSKFFNSWSELANKPQDAGLRQIVLQEGKSVAQWFKKIDGDLQSLSSDLNQRTKSVAANADQLASKIAEFNVKIVEAESVGGGAQANGLRDQRDTALKELSAIMDIRTIEQPSGVVNVYVGSEPLVSNGSSRGVSTSTETLDGQQVTKVTFTSTGGDIRMEAGQLGALQKMRVSLDATLKQTNDLATGLIFSLNKTHSAGQGLAGVASVIGTTNVTDTTKALNDPTSGVRQPPSTGSFVVHVKDKATGLSTSTLVQIDLDGQGADTTLDSLITQLDGVDGITAVNNAGRLQINADNAPATEITFSQDSSGTLASLGVNTFFTGHNANTIDINATVKGNPQLLAAAQNGNSGDNQTARAIANLEKQSVTALNGQTLTESYESIINTVSTDSSTAKTNAEASSVVLETLQAQREALSGVSLDEEAVNIIRYQRAFQGAARLITVVDEMMQTMLNMVR